jgi:hypothetical protein
MLLYKAWCETRSRFAIGVAALAAMTALAAMQARGARGVAQVVAAVYGDSNKTTFALLAIVLGIGSLRQERALGTLGFSLALPVPRSRLVAARAAVGLAEVGLIALFVGMWLPAVTAIAAPGCSIPIPQALRFAALWAGCGIPIWCLAQLLATLVASDYVAYLGALMIVVGYEALLQLTALRDRPLLDLYRVMAGVGEPYLRADGALVALPWPALAGAVAAGAALLGLAVLRTRRLAL